MLQELQETHEKGEGSIKSAIRLGLEFISDSSKGGGLSSSSSMYSVMVMLLLAAKKGFLCLALFSLAAAAPFLWALVVHCKDCVFMQSSTTGCALEVEKQETLTKFLGGYVDAEVEGKEQEENK